MSEIICSYAGLCGGCNSWSIPYEKQMRNKIDDLSSKLEFINSENVQIEFISLKKSGLRDRFDFTFENKDSKKMGLYAKNHQLIDLNECLQLNPELQKVFSEFKKIEIKTSQGFIQKGSVRLRRGPTGLKGCWLDLANTDIKNLLEDSTYLTQLLAAGFQLEMGQKGKSVKKINDALKLTEPEPKLWFQTIDQFKNALPLHSLISDFTQPSWVSAQALCEILLSWIEPNAQKAIEFGPGVGQLTLPLLSKNIEVHCFENNPKATEVLKINSETNYLSEKIKIHLGDFQSRSVDLKNQKFDFALVNPPRSGLKKFTQTVIDTKAPQIYYVSCFPDSLCTDLVEFKKAGYHIRSIKIVDQFPQTSHYESCVWLSRD